MGISVCRYPHSLPPSPIIIFHFTPRCIRLRVLVPLALDDRSSRSREKFARSFRPPIAADYDGGDPHLSSLGFILARGNWCWGPSASSRRCLPGRLGHQCVQHGRWYRRPARRISSVSLRPIILWFDGQYSLAMWCLMIAAISTLYSSILRPRPPL